MRCGLGRREDGSRRIESRWMHEARGIRDAAFVLFIAMRDVCCHYEEVEKETGFCVMTRTGKLAPVATVD